MSVSVKSSTLPNILVSVNSSSTLPANDPGPVYMPSNSASYANDPGPVYTPSNSGVIADPYLVVAVVVIPLEVVGDTPYSCCILFFIA